MKLLNLIATGGKVVVYNAGKYAPEILTGASLIGLAATSFFSAVGYGKAKEAMKSDEGDRLDRTIETAKAFAPAAASGLFTAGCIISAQRINHARLVATATALAASQISLKDLKDEAKKVLGEHKYEKVVADAKAKELERHPYDSRLNPQVIGAGPTRCFDAITGRYFWADISDVKKSEAWINASLYHTGYVSLNEFYYNLGLDPLKIGDDLGWNANDGCVDFEYSSCLGSDDVPCLCIDTRISPRYDFRSNW